ncbi:MAG: ChaN family lipoprotein [Candidatus Rokubacteria bacterium]|nr:ChaN family lipoprotein [Candidatus Rokubacteria bacterium]
MRRASIVLAALVCLAAAPLPEWQSPLGREHPMTGTIWDVRAGTAVTPEALVSRVAARRFVLLGEKHDNPDHHRLQAWVLGELVAAGRRPAAVFEMFRADQAETIARHLAASPTDSRGLGDALDWRRSGWPAWSMYEPIVAIALAAKLPVVAGNLSRDATTAVRRGTLDAAETARMGLDRPLPEDVRQRLADEIRDGHCGHLPEHAIAPFVAVQRARDAHMAAAMRASGGDGAVLIAGVGHVRRDMGVARLLPDAETASIAFVEVPSDMTAPPALPADYVWLTPRMGDRDPCERFRKDLEKITR